MIIYFAMARYCGNFVLFAIYINRVIRTFSEKITFTFFKLTN